MSIKAYKYRISANKHTTEKLQWVLDRCRELYNAGLQERRDAYEMGVKRHPNYYDDEARKQLTREYAIGYYDQKRELVDIKALRPEYQNIASHVLQDVILRLKGAYDDFFQRVQNGKQPGYPRFQGKNRYDSFTYPDGAGWKLDAKERQGSMGRAHGRLCFAIHDITTVFGMWRGGQKRPVGTVAQLQVWQRTGPRYQLSKAHLTIGIPTTFGRDAANAGNGVEAFAFYAEVRSLRGK